MCRTKRIILCCALLLNLIPASAYDFESGGLFYNILSVTEKTCEVTFKTLSYNSYSGDVAIPDKVTNDGVTYSVTAIGDNAFRQCTSLISVTIGDNLKSIGNYAFSGCCQMERFTFGESLQSIGDEAFSDCVSVVELAAEAPVPPVCGSRALDDLNKSSCKLYVPFMAVSAYLGATQWGDFLFVDWLVVVDRRVNIHFVDNTLVWVNFSASPKLNFSGNEVTLTSSCGQETWTFDEVERLTFGKQYTTPTDVESVSTEKATISFHFTSEGLFVSGAESETVTISDLSGQIHHRYNVGSPSERVSLSGLPTGVYIVSVGGKAVKIAKK